MLGLEDTIDNVYEPNATSILRTTTAICFLLWVVISNISSCSCFCSSCSCFYFWLLHFNAQSRSLDEFLLKQGSPALLQTLDTKVTDLIIALLAGWKTDFCFLFYYAVEKAYLVIIARTLPALLLRIVKRREKAKLEALKLHPYHPLCKGEVTVTAPPPLH